MKRRHTREIALAGVVAALYAVLTVGLAPISYGVYQVRIAECLTLLPYLFPWTVLGLFAGCLVANIFGGNGLYDIVFGSLFTLLAGYLTYLTGKIGHRRISLALAPLPPVVINAFGVALYLHQIMNMSYLFVVQMIALGQLVACYLIGLPLILYLKSRKVAFHEGNI